MSLRVNEHAARRVTHGPATREISIAVARRLIGREGLLVSVGATHFFSEGRIVRIARVGALRRIDEEVALLERVSVQTSSIELIGRRREAGRRRRPRSNTTG